MRLVIIVLLVIFIILLVISHELCRSKQDSTPLPESRKDFTIPLEEDLVYFSKIEEGPSALPPELPDFIEVGSFKPADEIFTARVTAYCHCKKCCGKPPGHKYYKITSSGKKVQEFHTIAMDKRFPFGTEVIFLNYEPFEDIVFVVEDRFGGGDHGNKIDVYFPSHAEALRFGRRRLEVAIYYESP